MNSQHRLALAILSKAFLHVSTHWTNRGFKIKQDDGSLKTCVYGAIDLVSRDLLGRAARDDDYVTIVMDSLALNRFGKTLVSVNDDLGYRSVTELFALAIHKVTQDAFRADLLSR